MEKLLLKVRHFRNFGGVPTSWRTTGNFKCHQIRIDELLQCTQVYLIQCCLLNLEENLIKFIYLEVAKVSKSILLSCFGMLFVSNLDFALSFNVLQCVFSSAYRGIVNQRKWPALPPPPC